MKRIDDPSATTSKPTPSMTGTAGWFREGAAAVDGTLVTPEFLNMLQGEIYNLLSNAGVAEDGADDEQLSDLLGGVICGDAADTATPNPSTHVTRALLATTECYVDAGADNAVVMACDGDSYIGATVTKASVIASDDGCAIGVSGVCEKAAIIASSDSEVDISVRAVILASLASSFYLAQRAGILACDDSLIRAATRAAAIACDGGIVSGSDSLLLGSLNAELHDSFTIGGGYDASAISHTGANQHITWTINSQTGRLTCQRVSPAYPTYTCSMAGASGPGFMAVASGHSDYTPAVGDKVRGVYDFTAGSTHKVGTITRKTLEDNGGTISLYLDAAIDLSGHVLAVIIEPA